MLGRIETVGSGFADPRYSRFCRYCDFVEHSGTSQSASLGIQGHLAPLLAKTGLALKRKTRKRSLKKMGATYMIIPNGKALGYH
jgi:hypothetical protein